MSRHSVPRATLLVVLVVCLLYCLGWCAAAIAQPLSSLITPGPLQRLHNVTHPSAVPATPSQTQEQTPTPTPTPTTLVPETHQFRKYQSEVDKPVSTAESTGGDDGDCPPSVCCPDCDAVPPPPPQFPYCCDRIGAFIDPDVCVGEGGTCCTEHINGLPVAPAEGSFFCGYNCWRRVCDVK